MNLTELKTRPAAALVELGESLGVENLARSRKQDIIFSILKAHAQKGENIFGEGILEILQDGFGFLRSPDSSYLWPKLKNDELALPSRSTSIS